MNKIKSQKEIIRLAGFLKKKRKKIVVYNGSFDLLHLGHIKSIKEAKKQGDVLIILLNSDKSVKSYKGPLRPIVSQKERAETLSALSDVDYVVLFEEINPKKILEKIRPDVFCNGSDWGKDCVEAEVVKKYGGRVHVLKWTPGYSTTGLIKKILGVFSKPSVRAVFLDRDGTINVNEPEYLHKKENFKFTKLAKPALQKLSKSSYKIFIVTNQSGIARGYCKISDFKKLNSWMLGYFRKSGIRIDKVYFCPHGPESKCPCRKPNPGMVQKAVREFGIDLSKSWIVGDSWRDINLGREVNLKTILMSKKNQEIRQKPRYKVNNLMEAVNIILKDK